MANAETIEKAVLLTDNDFDNQNGKTSPVEIHYRFTMPFTVETKEAGMDDDDVKVVGPVYVGSDEMLDRHGELVTTDAIMSAWDKYANNPVILYNHSKTYGVIGRMSSVKMGDFNGLKVPIGTAIIDGGEKDITRKIRKGMLKAFSIGFIAKAAVKECKDEDTCYMKFVEIDWVETSVVDVPASPNALFSVEKSIVLDSPKIDECGCSNEQPCSDSSVKSVCAFAGLCDCEGDCLEQKKVIPTETKHILRIAEDDDTLTIVFAKPDMEDDKDHYDEEDEEMGYDDEEEGMKEAITRMNEKIDALTDAIGSKAATTASVNTLLCKSDGLMDSADTIDDVVTEDAVATEEESLDIPVEEKMTVEETVEETPADEDEDAEEEVSEDAEEEVSEKEVPLPKPAEVLMEVGMALKDLAEKVAHIESALFTESEEPSEEDEIASLKSEIEALKAEKAAAEAEAALEAEVERRVAEKMAGIDVSATPSRKSIPHTDTEAKGVTRFDPTPEVSKGTNGLAKWLEFQLVNRN